MLENQSINSNLNENLWNKASTYCLKPEDFYKLGIYHGQQMQVSNCEKAPSIIQLYLKLFFYAVIMILGILFVAYIFKLVWSDISSWIDD